MIFFSFSIDNIRSQIHTSLKPYDSSFFFIKNIRSQIHTSLKPHDFFSFFIDNISQIHTSLKPHYFFFLLYRKHKSNPDIIETPGFFSFSIEIIRTQIHISLKPQDFFCQIHTSFNTHYFFSFHIVETP